MSAMVDGCARCGGQHKRTAALCRSCYLVTATRQGLPRGFHECMDCGAPARIQSVRCVACSRIERDRLARRGQASRLAARFWEKVPDQPSDPGACWEWSGSRTAKGYGRLNIRNGVGRAHRIAYRLTIGPVPEGMLVLHRCDNPPCVRPSHLFVGTYHDNSQDMARKGRWRNGTHCGDGRVGLLHPRHRARPA